MPLPDQIIKKSFYIMKMFNRYKKMQYWEKEKLAESQIGNLQKILYNAKLHVPYYSELFGKINLDPSQVKHIDDLKRIPVVTRQDIIRDTEKFMAKNHKDFNPSWHHTSGTTGSPLSFLLDKKADLARLGSLLRCWNWAGYFPGMKVFSLQQGASLGFTGVKKLPLQRTLKLSATSLNMETAIKTNRLLLDFKPNYYIAYPYSLENFIKYGLENLEKIHKPKVVICSGENLDKTSREYIESTLDCEVYDFYSHVESVIMGMEDQLGHKYLMDDYGICEILDEKTGLQVKAGETGLLIGTGLNNYSMPFIRYQVGDKIKTLANDKKSKNKFHMQRYEKLMGRDDDVIYTPEGKKLSILDDILHQKLNGIISSQLVQEKLDTVKLRIIRGKNFSMENITKIRKEMKNLISAKMKYEFEFVDKLEINKEGKIPFIISRIKKGH